MGASDSNGNLCGAKAEEPHSYSRKETKSYKAINLCGLRTESEVIVAEYENDEKTKLRSIINPCKTYNVYEKPGAIMDISAVITWHNKSKFLFGKIEPNQNELNANKIINLQTGATNCYRKHFGGRRSTDNK